MTMKRFHFLALPLCLGAIQPAIAGMFDGSQSLLCASVEVAECDRNQGCQQFQPDETDFPQFLRIDFAEKKISTTPERADPRTTEIERMERVDGKLMIQGTEDGRADAHDGLGWTLSISEADGRMVLTGSAEHTGFVVFGACTPL